MALQVSSAMIWETVFHPRGSMILAGSWSNQVTLYSLDGRELIDVRRPGGGGAVAWSPDSELIASGLRVSREAEQVPSSQNPHSAARSGRP